MKLFCCADLRFVNCYFIIIIIIIIVRVLKLDIELAWFIFTFS